METKNKKTLNEVMVASQEQIITPETLNPQVVGLLLQRLKDEYTAHYFYTDARNWCKGQNYKKAAAFFEAEAASELTHAVLIQDFLTDWNVQFSIPPVELRPSFIHLIDIVNKAYRLEYNLFTQYNSNSAEIFPSDMATFDFLQQLRQIQNQAVAEYSDLINAAQLVDVSNKLDILFFETKYFKV